MLSDKFKETVFLQAWSWAQMPGLFFIRPRIIEINEARCEIRVPLRRRTRNYHVGAMYFGALCSGADCAGGLIAMRAIQRRGNAASLIFKNFEADFQKRADGDVHFSCEEGEEILALVDRVLETGERETLPVHITATVPSKYGSEPVARFTLGLSLKRKG